MNGIKKLKSRWLLMLIALSFPASAEIKLPTIFGNNMVLQRNSKESIWGTVRQYPVNTMEVGRHHLVSIVWRYASDIINIK
ncbi:hypothetical protein [Flavivirga sp. 57AJ16]|uniref:hypothetical protein n=1 Tax=Flavivirga sp. 57AJ16 TaxID=3025307 RepID=UPI002365EF40|nr:hypothetical protein [Flavivirga sp. 57AJ16]MDD7885444.1 hypothetical protein [Flavivirga sp. 57AJ16]